MPENIEKAFDIACICLENACTGNTCPLDELDIECRHDCHRYGGITAADWRKMLLKEVGNAEQ